MAPKVRTAYLRVTCYSVLRLLIKLMDQIDIVATLLVNYKNLRNKYYIIPPFFQANGFCDRCGHNNVISKAQRYFQLLEAQRKMRNLIFNF